MEEKVLDRFEMEKKVLDSEQLFPQEFEQWQPKLVYVILHCDMF